MTAEERANDWLSPPICEPQVAYPLIWPRGTREDGSEISRTLEEEFEYTEQLCQKIEYCFQQLNS